jgi:LuxR family transcriptional regulator, maltose regulon positive regulatory protein
MPKADGARSDAGERATTAITPSGIVVVESKLRPGPIRTDLIQRESIAQELIEAADKNVILVDAPIGYGKTTLLMQWRVHTAEPRPFAWVTLDGDDNDLMRLWTYIAEAVRRVEPQVGAEMMGILRHSEGTPPEAMMPRLINELAVLPRKIVIVLDDLFEIKESACIQSIGLLIEYLPPTAQLVIATRSEPPMSLNRLRLADEMLEIRTSKIRFQVDDASSLLRRVLGRDLPPREVEELVERTEGWPAGLYLAALSLQGRVDTATFVEQFAGDHRHVADYLTMEVLNRQPERTRRFLARTSILDRLTASLCDAVTGMGRSASTLDELERSNLFLVAIDERRQWYRYHRLFQGLLKSELRRSEGELVPELHRRASAWHRKWGFLREAIGHAIAADDMAEARELISGNWTAYFEAGQIADVQSWLDAVGTERLASDPVLALTAAWIAGLSGRSAEGARWLELAAGGSFEGALPDGTTSLESGIAMARATFAFRGVADALAAARRAVQMEAHPKGEWRAAALTMLGYYLYLSGRGGDAIKPFEEVAALKHPVSAINLVFALSQLSMIASDQGRRVDAEALALEARGLVDKHDLSRSPHVSTSFTALGRVLGDKDALGGATMELERGLGLLRGAAVPLPWSTLQALLALAPVRSAQGDHEGAQALVLEAADIVRRYEDAGDLVSRLRHLERSVGSHDRRLPNEHQSLTDRELTILKLLPSDLSQRQIGAELFMSINTVKSHVKSIFRKLGVSNRQDAVARAKEQELI